MATKNERLPLPEDAPAFTLTTQEVPAAVRPLNAVVVGNAGSGKSSAGRAAFVEPLLEDKRRVCIFDPTGVWWGLRFRADGSPGFAIAILGGLYGDAPLQASDGERCAQWIGEHDGPVILDVSELTIGERHEFGTDFFQALYKHNRRPLHLIVDEADEVAPQNPLPETKRMLHHFDRIVRRGRVRGFRVMMITQRPAVLHKNVLSQANVLIAMRLLGSQDRDAVLLWIKGQGNVEAGKEVLNTLAKLKVGEGWLWAPSVYILNRGRFPMFYTFDSSRTPGDDEPPVEPPGPFPYSFDDLVAWMLEGAQIQEKQEGERVSKRVARQSDSLDTDDSPASVKFTDKVKYWRDVGYQEGFKKGYDASNSTLVGQITGVINAGNRFMEELRQIGEALSIATVQDLQQTIQIVGNLDTPKPDARQQIAEVVQLSVARSNKKDIARARFASVMPPAAQKLLIALSRYPATGITWEEACVAATMSHGNGFFYGGAKYLRENGLCEETGSAVRITKPGLKLAGDNRPLSLHALLTQWAATLKAPGGDMLAYICRRPYSERHIPMKELAEGIGRTPGNGFWYGGIKAITKHHLAGADRDAVWMSDFLFRAAKVKP